MSGYFYAFEDKDAARAAIPEIFTEDDGEWSLRDDVNRYSTRGVWTLAPEMSELDENGEQTVVTPGERSANYVILTAHECGDCEQYLINPPGVQGFA